MNIEVEEVSSAEAVGTGIFDSSPSSAPTIEELLDGNEGLLEVGRSGAGSAANALSEVLMEEITIDVSEAHIIPSERIHEMYVDTDHEVIVSLMEMGGRRGATSSYPSRRRRRRRSRPLWPGQTPPTNWMQRQGTEPWRSWVTS